jgi:hypothetical protein
MSSCTPQLDLEDEDDEPPAAPALPAERVLAAAWGVLLLPHTASAEGMVMLTRVPSKLTQFTSTGATPAVTLRAGALKAGAAKSGWETLDTRIRCAPLLRLTGSHVVGGEEIARRASTARGEAPVGALLQACPGERRDAVGSVVRAAPPTLTDRKAPGVTSTRTS